jgi:pyruvate/2-oxoglutarate/acetoin dehydrogenase E1 component
MAGYAWLQAIRSDNPIIFFEHVLLYNLKGEVSLAGTAMGVGVRGGGGKEARGTNLGIQCSSFKCRAQAEHAGSWHVMIPPADVMQV